MSNIDLRHRMRHQEDLTKATYKLRPEEWQFELEQGMFYSENSSSVDGGNPDQIVKAEKFAKKRSDLISHAQGFGSL